VYVCHGRFNYFLDIFDSLTGATIESVLFLGKIFPAIDRRNENKETSSNFHNYRYYLRLG
jgi:hypothetical protein